MLIEEIDIKPKDNLSETEKSATFRRIFKTLKVVAPKMSIRSERLYTYLRYWDDLVDESPYIQPVIKALEEERDTLASGTASTLQDQYIEEALDVFSEAKADAIKGKVSTIMGALLVDARLRFAQTPVSEAVLRNRSFNTTWSVLDILSIATVNKNPRPTTGSVDLMQAIANHDHLGDLSEDLSHGLIMISKEDSERFGISFRNGQQIPTREIEDYYYGTAGGVKKDLVKYSPTLFRSGLPVWLATLVFIYCNTRRHQFHGPAHLEGTIYQAPLDAKLSLS